MTFSQLQFIKSEAAYLAGDMAIALEAYKEGVNAHLDFARPYSPDQEIYDQRRALMESSDVVFPETSAGLTLSKIMLQKYKKISKHFLQSNHL